jgi:hypothetical protein
MSVSPCSPLVYFSGVHTVHVSSLKKQKITHLFVSYTAFLEILFDADYTLDVLVPSDNILFTTDGMSTHKLKYKRVCKDLTSEIEKIKYRALLTQLGALINRQMTSKNSARLSTRARKVNHNFRKKHVRHIAGSNLTRFNTLFIPEGFKCIIKTKSSVHVRALTLLGNINITKKQTLTPLFYFHSKEKHCPSGIDPIYNTAIPTDKTSPIAAVVQCMKQMQNLYVKDLHIER